MLEWRSKFGLRVEHEHEDVMRMNDIPGGYSSDSPSNTQPCPCQSNAIVSVNGLQRNVRGCFDLSFRTRGSVAQACILLIFCCFFLGSGNLSIHRPFIPLALFPYSLVHYCNIGASFSANRRRRGCVGLVHK